MKKAILIIIAAIFLLLAAGCGSSDVPDGMIRASVEADSFDFFVPNGWTVNNGTGTASAFYSTSDKSNVSFIAMVAGSDMSDFDEYIEKADASFASTLSGYSGISERKEITMCGQSAVSFEYRATADGNEYRFLQVVTFRGLNFYVFTYTALAEKYEDHLGDVEKIIENVRFK